MSWDKRPDGCRQTIARPCPNVLKNGRRCNSQLKRGLIAHSLSIEGELVKNEPPVYGISCWRCGYVKVSKRKRKWKTRPGEVIRDLNRLYAQLIFARSIYWHDRPISCAYVMSKQFRGVAAAVKNGDIRETLYNE